MIKGIRAWKAYYGMERERDRDKLVELAKKSWRDDELVNVLKRGGVLSFPHTIGSAVPVLKVVEALYSSGFGKVTALGVRHSLTDLENEFSLDGFEYMSSLFADVNGLKPLIIEKKYPPLGDYSLGHIAKLRGERLEGPLVMTGDLVHYGHGYNTAVGAVGRDVRAMVLDQLDLVYCMRDYPGFVQVARIALNDQVAAAVMASEHIGEGDYKVYSLELPDYSWHLSAKKPTVVASVLYGAWPA